MNEDAYLEEAYENLYSLEPLDGYGDEAEWFEDEWDDDPNPYEGNYSEE